jgi:tetratricopeptide (TPR) repeat protein
LLDLSCSYTNNLSRFGALNNLKKWILNHPLYGTKNDENDLSNDIKTLEKDVLNLFLSALEKDSKDVSLYTALGVLYNITNDYDSAEKFFLKAIEINPDSFALWNKLGATRANSNLLIKN